MEDKKVLVFAAGVLFLGLCVFAFLAYRQAQSIPADISKWQKIDTTLEDNKALFESQGMPNPMLTILTPANIKWTFEAEQKAGTCSTSTSTSTKPCLETESLTLVLRENLENTQKKYLPGYSIKIKKATGTLDSLIPVINNEYKKENIESTSKVLLGGIPAYLVVLDRTEVEANKFYSYHLINNGAEISISTYIKPTPDFLETLRFQ